jgi:ArsR family transcriptional regulator
MPSLLAIFQALADQTRLRILALLRDMELSVGELAQVLGQSQPAYPAMSKFWCRRVGHTTQGRQLGFSGAGQS